MACKRVGAGLFASRQAIVDVPPMVRRGVGGIDAADFHRVERPRKSQAGATLPLERRGNSLRRRGGFASLVVHDVQVWVGAGDDNGGYESVVS